MTYQIQPLACDPASLNGLSEQLIRSHHENNYSGAVKCLNAISARLQGLDFTSAAVFELNGLKREELIAANSMILHELYFDSLSGAGSAPLGQLADALHATSAALSAGLPNSAPWARHWAVARAGYC